MPIYEYRCTECQQLFEEWCKHIEDKEVQHSCPICKGRAERLISNTSFALKGGGWYVTEYGSHKGIKEDGASASCDSPAPGGDKVACKADACAASPSPAPEATAKTNASEATSRATSPAQAPSAPSTS